MSARSLVFINTNLNSAEEVFQELRICHKEHKSSGFTESTIVLQESNEKVLMLLSYRKQMQATESGSNHTIIVDIES